MRTILLSALGVAALTAMLWADPPARVGRLAYVEGTVSFSPTVGGQWQTAHLNYPLTTGNQLSTPQGARAEVQIGSTSVLIGSDTGVTFEALDDQTVQIRLDKGIMSIRMHELGQDQSFQVDTQTATISLTRPGLYRVDQNASGDASVITRSGDAEVTGGAASFHVYSGQSASIPASGPDAHLVSSAPPADRWDTWVAARDSREAGLSSTRYVSSEMDGVQDLDEYGAWRVVAGYGPVWIPAGVPVGWEPYTFGHWVWIEPWGWTWVDDEPWGFAPFHYGRWVLYTGVWCWVPGPIVRRPVYAPALVRWVGGPPAVGVVPSRAHINWVPLQPRQVFRPSYQVSPTYFRAVNGTVVYRPPYRQGAIGGTYARTVPSVPNGGPVYQGRTYDGRTYVERRPAATAVPVRPSQPVRPEYVPPRGQEWTDRPAYTGPSSTGHSYGGPSDSGPAYVAPPADRGRRWVPSSPDYRDYWPMRRSGR